MVERFVISDTHFGHDATWEKFKREDGVTPLRPFTSTEEMDETMIANWNRVVQPHDKVYHLGDVVIAKRHLPTLARLNGKKQLVMGNHDLYKASEYLRYFDDLWGCKVYDDVIMSHVPLKADSVKQRWVGNLHGHLHERQVGEPRYYCVSVEQIDYTPLSWDDARERLGEI